MAWTLHLLVCITMTASAYKYEHASYTSSDSYSPNVLDDVKFAQLRIGEQTPTRTENESNAESRRGQNTDKIVFPATTTEEFQLEIPEHCKRLGFCEDIPNYPNELAKKVISELSNLRIFQDDKLDLPDVPDITQRLGPHEENIELCKLDEKTVYPKVAIDSSGKWHVVLNQDENPIQGFKVEICSNVTNYHGQTSELKIREGEWQDLAPCLGFAEFKQGEYQGLCEQKFVYLKMRVLLNDGSTLERSLRVPSCCSCVGKRT